MLTEEEVIRASLFLTEEAIEKSPAGEEESYQALLKDYEKCRRALCARLGDRRLRLLEELLGLRDQLEYERSLHYLNRAFARGKSKGPGKQGR